TEQLGAAVNFIQQEGIGAGSALKEAKNAIQKVAGISNAYQLLFDRLQSVFIEVDDIAAELESALEKVEANPQELEQVSDKLQVIYNLQKKHLVSTVAELKSIEVDLERKVSVSENAEEEIKRVEAEIAAKAAEVKLSAAGIHE